MRRTAVLCRTSNRWALKEEWKRKGVIWQPPTSIPKPLIEKGVKIIDPVEVYLKPPRRMQWVPPVPDDLRFSKPTPIKEHPDYKDTPIYTVTAKSQLLEGSKQATILTKTQPFEGLPNCVSDRLGEVGIPLQDMLVQRYIMQANRWNPTKDKLPKRHNPELPIWNFKAEFGIPRAKRQSILLQNLLRLMQMLGASHPDLVRSRRLAVNHLTSASYDFQDDKQIRIQNEFPFMLTSNRPLPQFASDDLVDASVTHTLPDIYPIAPTIDLKKEHVWRAENITGFEKGFSHAHPHTMYMTVDNAWTTDQRNAVALLFCYGQCLAHAKERYGWDATKLDEPISTQLVYTDGTHFNFVFYQLNTLNAMSSDGIKNLAWFDNDNALYERIEPKRAMLRNTKYQDYDPAVLDKLLATFITGAELEHSVQQRKRGAV